MKARAVDWKALLDNARTTGMLEADRGTSICCVYERVCTAVRVILYEYELWGEYVSPIVVFFERSCKLADCGRLPFLRRQQPLSSLLHVAAPREPRMICMSLQVRGRHSLLRGFVGGNLGG